MKNCGYEKHAEGRSTRVVTVIFPPVYYLAFPICYSLEAMQVNCPVITGACAKSPQ
jgi:hypothetical protein